MEQRGHFVEPAAGVHAAAAGEGDDGVRIGRGDRASISASWPQGSVKVRSRPSLSVDGIEADGDDDGVGCDANFFASAEISSGS